jgi:epoxyqueuosine reductase
MSLESRLREEAELAGLSGFGFCSADPFPEVRSHLEDAVSSGRSGGLGFTFTDPATSTDPSATFPWAVSVVSAAHAYLPTAGSPPDPGIGDGVIARFATEDHYQPLRAGLERIRVALVAAGHRAEVLCDDNRLVDRAIAVRAGVGWWGKSAMVLAPGSGPWLLLGSVVTDAVLQPDAPMRRDCGSCDACLPACPTGAIVEPGVLDVRRCLASIAQRGGSIPIEFRQAMGRRVYGCDECLVACPPGQRSLGALPRGDGAVDLLEMLRTADRPLRERFAHFYVPRNQARYLRRNAIVAIGNSGSSGSVLVLAGLLGHSDPLLRGHSAWALGRIGGPVAEAALRSRRDSEADAEVADEIERAIGTLG